MSKFYVETRPDAPCCYIICEQESDREVLIQSDMDYTSLARNMGWSCPIEGFDIMMSPPCGGCRCSEEIGQKDLYRMAIIKCAQQWIDDHLDENEYDDPGYFEGEVK